MTGSSGPGLRPESETVWSDQPVIYYGFKYLKSELSNLRQVDFVVFKMDRRLSCWFVGRIMTCPGCP